MSTFGAPIETFHGYDSGAASARFHHFSGGEMITDVSREHYVETTLENAELRRLLEERTNDRNALDDELQRLDDVHRRQADVNRLLDSLIPYSLAEGIEEHINAYKNAEDDEDIVLDEDTLPNILPDPYVPYVSVACGLDPDRELEFSLEVRKLEDAPTYLLVGTVAITERSETTDDERIFVSNPGGGAYKGVWGHVDVVEFEIPLTEYLANLELEQPYMSRNVLLHSVVPAIRENMMRILSRTVLDPLVAEIQGGSFR
jgi:hypothetical protein